MNDSEKIKQTFKDKDYRHGYVDEFLNAYIATQIKVLREKAVWTQTELGEHAGGMKQSRISVMENVNYSAWSIKVLRKIAEAFDLTLCVSFESFGKRIEDIESFNRKNLERTSFDNDLYFKTTKEEKESSRNSMELPKEAISSAQNNVIDIMGRLAKKAGSSPSQNIPTSTVSDESFCYKELKRKEN